MTEVTEPSADALVRFKAFLGTEECAKLIEGVPDPAHKLRIIQHRRRRMGVQLLAYVLCGLTGALLVAAWGQYQGVLACL